MANAGELALGPGNVARPEPVTFASAGGRQAHALYYAPTNANYRAEAAERPPLIVRSHGGPTGRASPALNLQIQYWTSRGFAVADVDYGGSTGYGRAYRQLLDGQWGVVDVEDCVAAARHLVGGREGGPGAARDPRRQCRRLHHALRPDLPRHVPGRCLLLRRGRPGDPGARHPQVREPLPRPAGRPLAGGRAISIAPARRCSMWTAWRGR